MYFDVPIPSYVSLLKSSLEECVASLLISSRSALPLSWVPRRIRCLSPEFLGVRCGAGRKIQEMCCAAWDL